MHEAKTTVTIRIAGDEHVLRSAAEPEYTRQCAKFLDDRVAEIRSLSRLPDTHRAVILAALSVTDQYFQTLSELEALKAEVTDRSTALTEQIEEAVEEAGSFS